MQLLRALLCLSLALSALTLTAQTRDIGPIDIRGDVRTIAVRVSSPDSTWDRLLRLGFGAHGRYRLADSAAEAAFDIDIRPEGGGARLEIRSGGRTVDQRTISGSNSRNALFRAADVAVERTGGLRGFFAGKLTFLSDRTGAKEVYISDFFFGEMLQMTSDRSQAVWPRWSPDGRRILYTSYYRSGFPDIFLIDVNSRSRTGFATFRGTNSGARFSPDGSRVAMVLSGEGNPEIYISNAQGRQVRRLTNTPSVEASPSWSPDGARLVFTSDRAGRAQLYLMPAAGGSMQRIATDISGYCAEPDWSRGNPDRLAFTVAAGGQFAVAVYEFSQGRSRIVSRGAGDAIEPVWLADGRHLLYTNRQANTRRLMLLDVESGKTTPWSPGSIGNASQVDYVLP